MSYEKMRDDYRAYYAARKEIDPVLGKFADDTIRSVGSDKANAGRMVDFCREVKLDAVANSTEDSCRSAFAAESAFEAVRRYATSDAPASYVVDSALNVAKHHADSRLRGATTARERQIAILRRIFPELL